MNTNKKILYLISILAIFVVSSCRVIYVENKKSENIKPAKLHEYILEKEFNYQNLNMKFSAEAMLDGKKETFSGIVRIQKDSIIWISLRAYSVEGARMCFTKDSIKFINRMNDTYFAKDFQSFASSLGIDIDYKALQSILTNSFFFYPCIEDENAAISNFKQCQDQMYYCMSSISQRKYSKYYSDDIRSTKWEKKLEKEIKDSLSNKEASDFVFQIVKITPEIYRVREMYLENHIQQQILNISYDKLVLDNNQYFPKVINMEFMTPYINMSLKMNVESININSKSLSFPFKISNKYKEITMP